MAITPGDFYQIRDIEDELCVTCRFRKNPDEDGQHAQEFPMCYEIEAEMMGDEPVEVLDTTENGMVVCSKYRPGDPWDFVEDPDQLTLGEL